jgi:hypothetical protein
MKSEKTWLAANTENGIAVTEIYPAMSDVADMLRMRLHEAAALNPAAYSIWLGSDLRTPVNCVGTNPNAPTSTNGVWVSSNASSPATGVWIDAAAPVSVNRVQAGSDTQTLANGVWVGLGTLNPAIDICDEPAWSNNAGTNEDLIGSLHPLASTILDAVDWFPQASSFDPWLQTTLDVLSRDLKDPAQLELKVSSEALAYYFAGVDFCRRPQLMVTEEGLPSFATVTSSFYFSLTVEDPNSLTLYAVDGHDERYFERLPFDRKTLPRPIESVLP